MDSSTSQSSVSSIVVLTLLIDVRNNLFELGNDLHKQTKRIEWMETTAHNRYTKKH